MATPNRFLKNGFPTTKKRVSLFFLNGFPTKSKKASLAHRVGTRRMKSAGPQNGDSIGDREGQARIQIGENAAFD